MTAFQEIIKTINNIKGKGNLLSRKEILSVLEATKQITKHQELINSLIFFFTTLNSKALSNIDMLSKRELEILQYIGHGKSSINIAKKLDLRLSTIETHRKNIRKKLGLVGKGKLIQYAILNNLRMLNSE